MKAARYLLVLASLRIALVHAQITTFKNVVVIFQENRTPDNLFQGLCTTPTACSITLPESSTTFKPATGWKISMSGGSQYTLKPIRSQ